VTALWYLTRGSGVVALLLLSASTVIGALSAGRWRSERWPRFAVASVHRNTTLVALVFIGIHVTTTIADSYVPVGLKDAVIPFVSQYRPIWLGFGALAFDLLLALAISSAIRRRIGYRAWRLLHWSAYAAWPLALVHGLGSGSDARFGWMAFLSFGCLTVVVLAVSGRLVFSPSPGPRLLAGAGTVTLALGLGAWYTTGPAQHGWASRAGTPKSLLKSGSAVRAPTRSLAAAKALTTFTGRLDGHMSSSGPDAVGNAAVAMAMATRRGEPGVVRLTLWGSALDNGEGLAMARSRVSFQDAVSGTTYTGSVVELDGNLVVAEVESSSGTTLRLVMRLQIDSAGATVTGTINASPIAGSAG
jgi:DMSO/TMAO reductase YedYZ heme-binding membrane subunit